MVNCFKCGRPELMNLFLSRISTLAQEIADGIGATEDATSEVNETASTAVLNLCYIRSSSGCG
uniref:Uncharacterized protein n=1 Tax=Daphnia galeata TaxID=27404 RepID=A0A8J2S3X7_9CRUS|nr:unnamed protein product [Daphnia galeata]